MKTHIFEIACSFAGIGCHIYPGNAVTERKYCGLAAATWKAAMPPLDGPAMWNFPPSYLVVRQDHLQELREDARPVLEEQFAVGRGRRHHDVSAFLGLGLKIAGQWVLSTVFIVCGPPPSATTAGWGRAGS